jgi:hypothetical protein
LKTDNTTISAIVPTATPIMEMIEITLIKFFFFLEKKYRLAIKRETFNGIDLVNLRVRQVVCEVGISGCPF